MDEEKVANGESIAEAIVVKEQSAQRLTARQRRMIAIAAIIVLPLAVLFYFRGHFVAAVVDGQPISRWRVVQELERQGGKTTLEGLIVSTLIENEAREKGLSVSEQEVDEEINNIKASIADAGGVFEGALAERGYTEESLRRSIEMQLQMRKLLAEKIVVTDQEIDAYVTDNKITVPKDPKEFREGIKKSLEEQKFGQEIEGLITSLKAKANIRYYVKY